MQEEVTSYEATLEQEYETLTEKHGVIKEQAEAALSQYFKQGKVKPVTIQGAYGSGKTQLLYHLFKYAWANGVAGVYTHLEKVIPPREMLAAEYADYLRDLIETELISLKESKSNLMTGAVKEYAIEHMGGPSGNSRSVVLLIDEFEQHYKALCRVVVTDDNSPMREVMARVNRGDAGFCLTLAFAPVSFYEFSKGEAQTGRYLPLILPIVEPQFFRKAFGKVGNLIWWMGRGRFRGTTRIRDIFAANVSDVNSVSRKELLDVSRNIGSIGGVPALDGDCIDMIEDFNRVREYLIYLEPIQQGEEIYAGNLRVVGKCCVLGDRDSLLDHILEPSLRECGTSKITNIAYYTSVLLDALSTSDGKRPLFTDTDDWSELFSMVEDVILEFEGEEELPVEDLRRLQDNASNFAFSIRHRALEKGELEEGYSLTPRFLRMLSPFPISSPNLTNVKIEAQREALADQTYLGRDERDGVSVVFFLNAEKMKDYLAQEASSYLNETKALVAVNLGEETQIEMTKQADWLRKQGRLLLVNPPRILSAFLVNFFYWLRFQRGENLPVFPLLQKLEESQSVQEKDISRKITYYTSRVREYLDKTLPGAPGPKYILGDKTNFAEFSTYRIGFPQLVIGFAFVNSQKDWEAMHKFRREFSTTQFVRKESADKNTGLGTALEKLVVEKKKSISKGAVLRRINGSFEKHIPDLREIAEQVTRDEFASIPADDDVQLIFEGVYGYVKEWRDPSKAEEKLRDAHSQWTDLTKRMENLSLAMNDFAKTADEGIHLTHRLEADRVSLGRIVKVLGDYQVQISPYTKFLLAYFVETTISVVEPRLNIIEKAFSEFKYSVEGDIDKYAASFGNIEAFDNDTFKWIGKKKKELKGDLKEEFLAICQELTKGARIDLENPPDLDAFKESIEALNEDLDVLDGIDDNLGYCKAKADEINERLKKWGAQDNAIEST